ncbi:MAG: EAL domain-containing protein [Betaproteobacteria bacterium]|nr:MAG: EAL domain-containing protein [Betaproteobacteria bacterium]
MERMTASQERPGQAQRGKTLFPFLVLGIGVALSLLLHFVIRDNVKGEAQLRFERQASDAQHVIEARIKSYADVLHGLGALFNTSNSIPRAEFRRYVAALDLPNRYPGFQGLNYAEYVPHEAKARFEARVRRDTSLDPRGYPNFTIKPAGDRPEYFVLNYLEPLAGNELAFGLDISSNPSGAAALAAARDGGKLTSSGRLLDAGRSRSVFLAMRLPTYQSGMPVETVEERRAAYTGSVGAGFRVRELIQGALDTSKLQSLQFRLYDAGPIKDKTPSAAIREDRLLFDSDDLLDASLKASKAGDPDALFTTNLPMEVGGRIWEVRFNAKKEAIIDRTDALLPWLTLAAGLVSSLLLFFALHSLTSSRRRALEMAQVITKDLRESEASLGRAQRIAQLGNWSLDSETGEMTWSAEMNRTFGNAATSTAQRYEDFLRNIHPKDRRVLEQALQQAVTTGQDSDMEHRIVTRDGMTRWVHTIVHRSQEASKVVLNGTIRDITERKLAVLRLTVEHGVTQLVAGATDPNEIMPGIIEAIGTGLSFECGSHWSLDKDGALLQCTASWGENAPAIAEFLALTKKMSVPSGVDLPGRAWAGHEPLVLTDVGSEQGFSRTTAALQAGLHGALALPIVAAGRNFGVIELFSAGTIQPDDALMQLLKSLSAQIGQSFQRRLAEDQLRFIATHDSLTDLPNRSLFNERLRHALHQGTRYTRGIAVMFIDMDRFKVVNDSLGHSAGDRLLQDSAKRLAECLRESDTVARLGGDEFVVMIENFTAPKDAIAVAQKALASLAKPFFVDGQEFLMSASIGISTFPDDGKDAETLLKNADIAMYRAKDQGRNNYQFYSAQMNKHTFERLAMESSLRRAVERSEFQLHYQPKLDLRTGAIAGVEALVRWQHPDWGMVSPAQFIPLAEETGLIVQIGEWVLRAACEQNKRWRDQGIPPLRVAVNLSARQFAQKTLLSDIAKTIAQSGLTPDCIELEITESLVMTNPEHATETLHKLKTMGISLSIDDFGTGYSSLAYLKRFPIDCIKIDRSFIKDIPTEADDMAITRGVIALGHSLRLKVVAEGVETVEQQDFLRSNDCDEMQGYLFSKPLPAEEVTALLKGHSPKQNLTVVDPRKRA